MTVTPSENRGPCHNCGRSTTSRNADGSAWKCGECLILARLYEALVGRDFTGALCAQTDPELFFPEQGRSAAPAKKLCRRCPAEAECDAYAALNDERYGIWGARSSKDREKDKRNRRTTTDDAS